MRGGGGAVTVSKDTQQHGLLEYALLLLWKRHCRAVVAFSFQAGCSSRPALDHELWPTDNTDRSRHKNLPSPE